MTTPDDQKPKDTTEAGCSAGVSCAAASGYPSIDHVLDALESMADQYLQIKDTVGRKRYDHLFMSAGQECVDVLIAAGRIPDWMDYRTGSNPP